MHQITHEPRRFCAFAPAALLLLALCLLAAGAQASPAPRYVVGDVLGIDFAGPGAQIVIARVDTTSLAEPYYHTVQVEQHAGRWEIPRYWHGDLEYTESQLVVNEHAHRVAHVDPVKVIITDPTITGGDMQFTGLSLAEAESGGGYWVEQPPGESSGSPSSYVVGDILGNVSDPDRGSVVARVYESDGVPWARVYFDALRSGDRWVIGKFYNNDMGYPMNLLGGNESRRVAHADPHTVIINDTTTSTGEIGWYRLSLAEFLEGKNYDWMGNWHFTTGDILGNGTATRYIVGSATVSDSGPSHYTLYEVQRAGDGWEIPVYVDAGIPLEAGPVQPDGVPYDFVDHTDPHFAVVTDPALSGPLTFAGLSLGEILEGTPGYLPETPGPIGGTPGYYLVSTVPAGAAIYTEDTSGTRHLQGNTTGGPLNVTIYLTATPVRALVANLSGYRDAVYTITRYPPIGGTVPVSLALQRADGGTPYGPLAIPGRVQGEDYDLGGEGAAYHDTTPGNSGGAYRGDAVDIETVGGVTDVGWIRDGEWLTFTVNVTQAGNYLIAGRVASPNSGRLVVITIDGGQERLIPVPDTGSFEAFQTVDAVAYSPACDLATCAPRPSWVTLPAGSHSLTLTFAGDGQNLDWIEVTPLAWPKLTQVPGGTALPTDPNGDGKHEDVNGNDRGDFADVVLYFNQMTWIGDSEPLAAFDYNGNGRVDFADVVWLFDHLGDLPAGRTYTVMAAAVGPGEIAPAGNLTVGEGETITFSLINRGTLPTPYATQSGYLVRSEVRVDPSVVPTPYPFPVSGGGWYSTRSYTLTDVRANHTVYGVFSYVPITA